jgi:hypothetical protein
MRTGKRSLAICAAAIWLLLGTGSAVAYYYPPTNVPPGPPPNYNQVDTLYFLGTPSLPLPPPDSGGIYIYYDQGVFNVANHIYSKGNSLEQFHCCVLVQLDQPPTPGVNVFAEQFELDVPGFATDTTKCTCLLQNDRWGWIPWDEGLYEIWWDVTTREWNAKCSGDPNDFMRFMIAGCALDFNLWSSDHGCGFWTNQIFLGAGKTPLSSVPGFVDTYTGVVDPYQSQAGNHPSDDPNVTIFTRKSSTLRSYNKLGLIHSGDSYSCDPARHYGERYSGTFAYEGNGVQFSTATFCPPNHDPSILITPDTSVFLCQDDSVRIWILASDPDGDVITVEKTFGPGTYVPQTGVSPISDHFYLHPDTAGVYKFIFKVTDDGGLTDEDSTHITVRLNRPPQLTCPEDDSVKAGETFTSSDYSVTDPDGLAGLNVTIQSVTPTPANAPGPVDQHVEWLTAGADVTNGPDFTFTLVATDPCGSADTCQFLVTVYPPLILIVPEDDSVHAGNYFTSQDFSVTSGKNSVTVSLCGITPTPIHQPVILDNHVEWQTECDDYGKVFTICLEAVDDFGSKDTGYFDVTVYNRPPEITCPDDGVVHALQTFVSSDFSVTDPDLDPAPVTFLDINPSPTNDPQVVGNHVEWVTTLSEAGDYIIRLVATDPCGLADTCQFSVFVDEPTGDFSCPEDDSVHAGDFFVSTNFVLTYPECDPSSVEILSIDPSPTHDPVLVAYHVEWQTTCEEDGDYVITLITGENCSIADTCSFTVTVYNRPPELICPDYGTVVPLGLFVSTDFYFSDPDGDEVSVQLLGIDPPAEHDPVIVEHHVEWQTECVLGDYVITLVATDECGLADTCEFMVTVTQDPVPDFYVWVYPITAYVSQGNSVGYLVELSSMNGYHKPCDLYVSGLPNPPNNAAFDLPVMTPSNFTTMTVYTSALTDTGTYALIVTGREVGGIIAHSKLVYLKVQDPLGPLDVDDETDGAGRPQSFALYQNQPNPFNPETQISYFLSQDYDVRVVVYNVLGERVRTLFEGFQGAGTHTLTWNGTSDQGNQLGSGIYFYQLQAGSFVETKKMTLMK